jgi:L-2,4-diaminobutyric acid acetyltransferase
MLLQVLCRESGRKAKKLETTVSPSNEASRKMFHGLAKALRTDFNEEAHFDAQLLGEEGHEAENLVTVGPFKDIA